MWPDAPLFGALHVTYVPVRVTRGTLVAHRYVCAPPSCRTSIAVPHDLYSALSVHVERSCWQNIFRDAGLTGFKNRVNAFLLVKLLYPILTSTTFPFLFFLSKGWYCGAGVFRLIGSKSLTPSLALPTSLKKKKKKKIIIIIIIIIIITMITSHSFHLFSWIHFNTFFLNRIESLLRWNN